MKTYINKIILFCLCSAIFMATWAQPSIDVCLRKTATKLEVVLTSNGSFTGLVSNVQMTIRCSDTTVTYGSPGDLQFFCSVAKGGDRRISGGFVYQKFGGIGFLTLTTLGITWVTGTETVLFSVVPSSLTPTFEIVNDTWTAANNGAYYAELNAIDKTGVIGTCGATLPIEGLQLEAEKQALGAVKLNWATEKEENGSTFIIQKRGSLNGFSVLGEVSGSGLSQYTYLDEGPMSRVNYYQVRQINPDGKEITSNIVEVHMEPSTGIRIYPNPAKQVSHIQLWEMEAGEKTITLLNSLGQIVQVFKSDASQIPLNLSGLAEGIYHVKVNYGDATWEKTLLKVSE